MAPYARLQALDPELAAELAGEYSPESDPFWLDLEAEEMIRDIEAKNERAELTADWFAAL